VSVFDREAHRTAARDRTHSHNDRLPPRSNWRIHRGANERRGGRCTALGVQLAILNASTPSQIETVFTTLIDRRIGALAFRRRQFFVPYQRDQIVRLAPRHWDARDLRPSRGRRCRRRHELWPQFGRGGPHCRHLCGPHLKGEKAADLPVQRSTRSETVINLKTAKALGLTVALLALIGDNFQAKLKRLRRATRHWSEFRCGSNPPTPPLPLRRLSPTAEKE
jgi:hypothetical protein